MFVSNEPIRPYGRLIKLPSGLGHVRLGFTLKRLIFASSWHLISLVYYYSATVRGGCEIWQGARARERQEKTDVSSEAIGSIIFLILPHYWYCNPHFKKSLITLKFPLATTNGRITLLLTPFRSMHALLLRQIALRPSGTAMEVINENMDTSPVGEAFASLIGYR